MYDWQEIAQMYKQELDNLQDEMFECSETLKKKTPHSYNESMNILVGSLSKSEINYSNIEIFENMIVEKKPKNKHMVGKILNKEYILTENDKNHLENLGQWVDDHKKRLTAFVNRYAVFCTSQWLESNGFQIIDKEIVSEKTKDSFRVTHTSNSRMRSVKVAWASIGAGGKANYLKGDPIGVLPKQHYYLVDLDKPRHDIYIFCNYSQVNESMVVYAWVKGQYIDKMIIEPLRERYKGKKGCIIEAKSLTGKNFPCSINELLHRGINGLREENGTPPKT